MVLRRLSCALLATIGLVAATTDVHAQSRTWVPWEQIGGGPAPASRPAPQAPEPQANRSAPRDSRAALASQRSNQTSGPAFADGGARPNISPVAPPVVAFTGYAQGSIVIDHAARALYYVNSSSTAYRYPISVGREGFGWRGTQTISRVASWPDWRPPAEMRQRDPRLPEHMSGGLRNPLGAMALYLGSSLYRIHGTNDQRSIGTASSSGCFRMMNSHVVHLATMAGSGTRVHVVDSASRNVAGGRGRQS
jgi:lipoprotein-anchoring transpeptidase ErfK/SrfK